MNPADNVTDNAADPAAAIEDFLDKWRARWPEWRIARIFVVDAQRPLAEAWFALLQEWTDAAWAGDDAAPGLAKLAWWQEELQGWGKGARRHPLGQLLYKQAAPWARLSVALPALHAMREEVRNLEASDAVQARCRSLAAVLMECEHALFSVGADRAGGEGAIRDHAPDDHMVRGRAAMLFAQCLWQHGPDQDAAAISACARALLGWPVARHAPRPCRIHDALARVRMRRIATSGRREPAPPMAALWSAWRAARSAEA